MLRDTLLEEILALPRDERLRLIEIITKSLEEPIEEPLPKRIPGLSAHSGFWMSEDFDDPVFPMIGWTIHLIPSIGRMTKRI